mgnify:CR=1 FL=1
MIKFLSKLYPLINFIIRIYNLIPVPIIHNLERISMYRKVFFYVNFERVVGDYLEFGTFEGTSMIAAYYANKSTSKVDNLIIHSKPPDRKYIGFDSFEEGFKYFDKKDKHHNYKEKDLQSSYKKVLKRLQKINVKQFALVNGFVEETLPKLIKKKNYVDGHEIKKASVVLFDMDLMHPTVIALDYIKDKLSMGSILIFDNFYTYSCDPKKGEMGAFNRFIEKNKNIELVKFGTYGVFGVIFIVKKI